MSSSSVTVTITWSSPQSGIIAWSPSQFSTGSAQSITIPSGASQQYFDNTATWSVSIASGYYILVLLYNVPSTPPSFTFSINGTAISSSSVSSSGSCGVPFVLVLSNGDSIETVTCCSFDSTSIGTSTFDVGASCSCSYVTSCSGCQNFVSPAWGFISEQGITAPSSSSPSPSSSGTQANNAFTLSIPSTTTSSSGNQGNNAFTLSIPSTKPTTNQGNNAFFLGTVKKTTSISQGNNAFFLKPLPTPSRNQGNNAFAIATAKVVELHVFTTGYAKFLSVPQAIYNVVKLSISSSSEVEQASVISNQIKISPTVSGKIGQVSTTTPTFYEQQVMEDVLTIPALYFLGKFSYRLIKRVTAKRKKSKGNSK